MTRDKTFSCRRSSPAALAATLIWIALAPAIARAQPGQDLGTHRSELLGASPTIDSSCTVAQAQFLSRALGLGRAVVASPAFEQCVARAVRFTYEGIGPYLGCSGDPGVPLASDVVRDTANAIAAARTPNDVRIGCANLSGAIALGGVDRYYKSGPEIFTWDRGWLETFRRQENYAEAVNTIWHEVMHQHGYRDTSKASCGFAANPSWHFQQHTMSYIVGRCMEKVIVKSGGSPRSCAGQRQAYELITDVDESRTTCIYDRDVNALGVLGLDAGGDFALEVFMPTGRPLGPDLRYTATSQVIAVADFDGQSGVEVLLRENNDNSLALVQLPTGSRPAGRVIDTWPSHSRRGSWLLHPTDIIDRALVGDLDGDGKSEIIVRDPLGFAALGLDAGGRFGVEWHWRFGGPAGQQSWTLADSDRLVAVGRFDASIPADTLLLQSADGDLGLVSLWAPDTAAAGVAGDAWTPLIHQRGQRLGEWILDRGNVVVGHGRLTARDRDAILIQSGWGMGVLHFDDRSAGLVSAAMMRYGSQDAARNWTFSPADRIIRSAIANFDGDERDEVLLRARGRLSVLEIDPVRKRAVVRAPIDEGDWIGDWRWTGTDRIPMAGDLDRDGRAEVFVLSGWGMGVLDVVRQRSLALVPHNARVGAWRVASVPGSLRAGAIVDVDGDGQGEMVVERMVSRLSF